MLSSIWKAIINRRSIRKYLSNDVSNEVILKVLEASIWAPSAHNAQPWRFIVISNPRVKRRLAEAMAYEWDKDLKEEGLQLEERELLTKASIKQFTQPPILIIICLTMKDMHTYPDEKRHKAEYLLAVHSMAASIQNLLLASYSVGLGSCWFCAPLFNQERVREILKIPNDVEPHALVTLGYPNEKPDTPNRKPLSSIVYSNYWGYSK
jgi:coenzyme F420-0:L-glutamate ligase/coenzyme F420-1:gamma-L-glutamate ligase